MIKIFLSNALIFFKFTFGTALLTVVHHIGNAATGLIDVGVGTGIRFFIDSSTLKKDGALLRYRIVGQETWTNFNRSLSAEVGVNCSDRTRIEYVTVLMDGKTGNQTTTNASTAELKSVYEGTRQADELTAACRLASEGAALPNKPPPLPQPAVVQPYPSAPESDQIASRPKSSGTGFAISGDGVFVTNFHVISECSKVRLQANGRLHDSTIIAIDEPNDLALVKTKTTSLPSLSLSNGSIQIGENIIVLGYPLTNVLGTNLKATSGIVSALSGIKGERRNMQISAAVQPGNSGGPVLNDKGEVVGVVVAKLASRFAGENVNFAIRSQLLRSFLEINSIDIAVQKKPQTLPVVEVIKKASPSVALLFCY